MVDSLTRVLALVIKELLAIVKDPRSRYTLFVPPLVQCIVFGYAASYNLTDVPYAVLDQSRGAASQQLLARLDGSGVFRRVANLEKASDVQRYIDERRALLVVRFGRHFERQMHRGERATVQIVADGRNSNTAGTALSYVDAIIDQFNADWRAHRGLSRLPVRVAVRSWFNPNLETRWNMVPALIATLTMLQTLLLTAMSVARERENGTFDQLLVTPYQPVELMIGKALPSTLVGAVQATTILLVAQLWFHIPFSGSFVTLYTGLGLFLLTSVGVGLFISSLVSTMQQALLFSFVLVVPFTILSGLATPISSMPVALQYLTMINPLRYALDLTHRVYLEGTPLGALSNDLVPLAMISALTLSVATWTFRRRIG